MRLAIKVLVMDDSRDSKIISVQKTAVLIPDEAVYSARKAAPILTDGLVARACDDYFDYLDDLAVQEKERTNGNHS